MLKDDELIGVIAITARKFARSPTSKSSCSELRGPGRHRHRERAAAQRIAAAHADLTESLEQQTATSKVLQIINSSPGILSSRFLKQSLEKAIALY